MLPRLTAVGQPPHGDSLHPVPGRSQPSPVDGPTAQHQQGPSSLPGRLLSSRPSSPRAWTGSRALGGTSERLEDAGCTLDESPVEVDHAEEGEDHKTQPKISF